MQNKPSRAVEISRRRLPHVLDFIQLRAAGLSVQSAADSVAMPSATIYRYARRFLALGLCGIVPLRQKSGRDGTAPLELSGSRANAIANERLGHVLKYFFACYSGVSPEQAAAGLPVSQPTVHEFGYRLLRYGLDGLAPNWRARERWKCELREFEVTPEIVDAVERLAGQHGSVWKAWKLFGRSRECPWRLSVFLRKRKVPPQFLLRAVRIQPVKARAWLGKSGRIYAHAGGKFAVIEKSQP